MPQLIDHLPSEIFIIELRKALNHLYDPDYLRTSRMAVILGVGGRFDTPSALQGLLTRAIETLKPLPNMVNKTHAQEIYDLLLYRYVQQFNQEEIANQLGVSVRHLRRQQNQAIYNLACKLWEQHHLEDQQDLSEPPQVDSEPEQDFDWIKQTASLEITDLSISLDEAHILIQPLAEQRGVRLRFPDAALGLALVHPVAFQQILLTLLSNAIHYVQEQEVVVRLNSETGWHLLEISAHQVPAGRTGLKNAPESAVNEQQPIEIVQKMVELSAGMLEYRVSASQFFASVHFLAVERSKVLVIDDNPDIIAMMERFTADSRYHITGLNDPKLAVERALQIRPDMVILDIMMPQVDGLQVLSRLKHHPDLGSVPVIICSVMPQKNLSASLGAAGFIQKPVQRQTLISMLEQIRQNSHPDA